MVSDMKAKRGAAQDFLQSAVAYTESVCLCWPYALNTKGYAHFKYNGVTRKVARVVCERVYGPPPTPRHEVAHSCGNRTCVAPRHLRWATSKENMADKLIHGTLCRGDRHPSSKLTEATVRAILAIPPGTRTDRSLADEYGVGKTTIGAVRTRISWAWLTATIALLVLSAPAMAQYYSPPAAPLVFPSAGQQRPWFVPPSAIPGTTPGTSLQSVPYAPPPQPPPVPPLPR